MNIKLELTKYDYSMSYSNVFLKAKRRNELAHELAEWVNQGNQIKWVENNTDRQAYIDSVEKRTKEFESISRGCSNYIESRHSQIRGTRIIQKMILAALEASNRDNFNCLCDAEPCNQLLKIKRNEGSM